MAKSLEALLAQCLEQLEAGEADIEACLRRYPQRAEELRPHLEMWQALRTARLSEPSAQALLPGRERLLSAASQGETAVEGVRGLMFGKPIFRVASVIGAVFLLGIAALGIAAAASGGDFVDNVLTTLHVNSPDDNANPNASERCDNAYQGRNNASDRATTGQAHANPRASEGGVKGHLNGLPAQANPNASDRCYNADQSNGADNAPSENANPNAWEGADNADDGSGNADENAEPGLERADDRASQGGQ